MLSTAGATAKNSCGSVSLLLICCVYPAPAEPCLRLSLLCVQVIGNTGSNSTGEALHATEQGFAVGMHAALQINPYYGKTSMSGLRAHLDAVLKEGPAIIYNVPSRTGQDIPDAVALEIAQHPNFLGMKECTGNQRIGSYTKQVRPGLGCDSCYSLHLQLCCPSAQHPNDGKTDSSWA